MIIIDDGSTDGTLEMIEKEFPEVILLQGDGNLWWTGAINLGVQHTLNSLCETDYILTLNNDTTVPSDYLSTLLIAAEDHPKSMIGSVAIDSREAPLVVDAGVTVNWLTAKYSRPHRGLRYEDLLKLNIHRREVDFLSGRGTLIPIETFRDIGLYNSVLLPHYGADYEYSHRARKNGYKLIVNYGSTVFSNIETTGLNNEIRPLPWREYFKSFYFIGSPYNVRYRWNFARLTCPRPLLPTFFIFDLCRIFFGTLRNQFREK
jgi:GT2 family glycosyltransferase